MPGRGVGPHTYDVLVSATIPNLRDLGGIQARGGQVVASGRLLRSALPYAGDTVPEGITWPPAVVIDLRSPVEHGGTHPLTGIGARMVNLPLLESLRPGWAHGATLRDLYALVLDEAPHLLAEVVGEVARADGASLVHCAAGKDRTGISVALVLSLLEVGADDIMADYLRTQESFAEIQARLRRDEDKPPVSDAFLSVDAAALDVALERWEAHPDGAAGWFLAAGGAEDDLSTLRSTMLSPAGRPPSPATPRPVGT